MPNIETAKMESSALLGGSFDPVSRAHVELFHMVDIYTPFKRLILIPASIPNFKRATITASYDDRKRMLELSLEDYRELYRDDEVEIEISDIERDSGKISYTSDTVRLIKRENPSLDKVNFIIGDDILERLDSWHDFDYIKRSVRFYVFRRLPKRPKYPDGAEFHFIENPIKEGSSTLIRNGNKEYLTGRVRAYIEENGLYRSR